MPTSGPGLPGPFFFADRYRERVTALINSEVSAQDAPSIKPATIDPIRNPGKQRAPEAVLLIHPSPAVRLALIQATKENRVS